MEQRQVNVVVNVETKNAKTNLKGNTYLFDSFSGFKEDDGIHKKDVFVYKDIDFIKENIKKLTLKRIDVFKGYFPRNLKVKIEKVKL